jgi:hypothetical protein
VDSIEIKRDRKVIVVKDTDIDPHTLYKTIMDQLDDSIFCAESAMFDITDESPVARIRGEKITNKYKLSLYIVERNGWKFIFPSNNESQQTWDALVDQRNLPEYIITEDQYNER